MIAIQLHGKHADGRHVIVSEQDAPLVSKFRWTAARYANARSAYAITSVYDGGKTRHVLMHRMILAANPGAQVDHIDGDGLNNQRENIRLCTDAQNKRNIAERRKDNSSGVTGVRWHVRGIWQARISLNGKEKHLGYFEHLADAAAARRAAEIEMFGSFAPRRSLQCP